jgi:hypothetical protein
MGIYINPRDMSKEQWLMEHARSLESPPQHYLSGDDIAVCLVVNTGFTAAAVAFSQKELEVFRDTPNDRRPKFWFYAPIVKVAEVTGTKLP